MIQPPADRMHRFRLNAGNQGFRVYCCDTPDQAVNLICRVVRRQSNTLAVASELTFIDEHRLMDKLDRSGCTLSTTPDRATIENAGVGICQYQGAVAESASLLHIATTLDERLVSILPLVHIALVEQHRLFERYEEMLRWLVRRYPTLPGFISLVSGPSKTADIERKLTTGVHGPAELMALFLPVQPPQPERKCEAKT